MEPKIFSSEVLVKVKACGINHLDIWVRDGLPGVTLPLPHILGCEITGEIAGIGSKVNSIMEWYSNILALKHGRRACHALRVVAE